MEVVSLLSEVVTAKGGGAGNGSQEVSHWPVEVRMLAIYPALGQCAGLSQVYSSSVRCILIWNYSRSCNLDSSVIETLQTVSYFLVLSVSCCLANMGACSCWVVVNAAC